MIGTKVHLDVVVDDVPPTLPQGPQENHENHEERNHFCTDRTGIGQRGDAVKVQPNSECSQDNSQISGPDGRSKPTPLSQIGFRDPASVGGGQQLTLLSIEVYKVVVSLLIKTDSSICVYSIFLALSDLENHNDFFWNDLRLCFRFSGLYYCQQLFLLL